MYCHCTYGINVRLVVDLTYSAKYYQKEEFSQLGVTHIKIPCRGRGEVPSPEMVNIFVYTMTEQVRVRVRVRARPNPDPLPPGPRARDAAGPERGGRAEVRGRARGVPRIVLRGNIGNIGPNTWVYRSRGGGLAQRLGCGW